MGIGHLGLCDGDKVSLSNLNRQILFTIDDLHKPKASTAEKRLNALNPNLKTTIYDQFLDEKLAKKIIPAYDIIVDCLDNFNTRFILNDACVAANKPFIHAGVEEYCGQMMTVIPGKSPCLRCLFPNGIKEKDGKKEKKPTGIIGPTPGVIGSIQALEAAKYLLDLPICNDGLIIYNGINLTMEKVTLNISQGCICSG
jgi:molybdopterin/thiamine biosynthesis adenylyltransferase